MHRIEIFKAGTHKPMGGEPQSFSPGDLDTIVTQNNGKEVPLVVGHPKTEDPAYGWAKKFGREGDTLYAEVEEIDPEFAQLVNDGKFRNVSISLNKDMSLRHIGFLGATPPAVKGLKPAKFSDGEDYMVFGEEEVTPPAQAEPPAPADPPAADPVGKKEDDPHLERIAALEAKLAALEAEKIAAFAEKKKAEFASFADELVTAGKVKQDMKARIVAVMEHLHQDDSGAMRFSDTEPEGVTAFRELLKALPKMVEPGRITAAQFADQTEKPKICKTPTELAAIISENMENN